MKSERMHQTERIKAKRGKYHFSGETPKQKGAMLHTATPCSCWMCGNPRKWFGERTIQERKAMQPELLG